MAGVGISQMPGFMAAEALRKGVLEEVLRVDPHPSLQHLFRATVGVSRIQALLTS